MFNIDIRIHLPYAPGAGTIEVSDVMIYKLTKLNPLTHYFAKSNLDG
jgi:hypothetical protein